MKKLPTSLVIAIGVVVIVGFVSIGVITGFLPVHDIFTQFLAFVFGLVVISILAIIGAIFLGMFISHRAFSAREFTTFEEEMLKMKRDVEDIKEKLDTLESNLEKKEENA
jgi:uncharacterized membrane protein